MIDYKDVRCPVTACSANKGERGCFCGFLIYGLPCDNPRFRDQWRERTGYQDPVPVEVEIEQPTGPHSLTWRADQARCAGEPMTPERARQLALALEMELSEVER